MVLFNILTWFIYLCFRYHSVLDWNNKDEDNDEIDVWEDNWDDDNPEEDFSVQLRSAVFQDISLGALLLYFTWNLYLNSIY